MGNFFIVIVLFLCIVGCNNSKDSKLYVNNRPKTDTSSVYNTRYSEVSSGMISKDSIGYTIFRDTCMLSSDFVVDFKFFYFFANDCEKE